MLFQVFSGFAKQNRIILQLSNTNVALRTKDTSHLSSSMVMVDIPLSCRAFSCWLCSLANSATVALRGKDRLKLLYLNAINRFNHVSSSVPWVNRSPMLHRTRGRAKLSMVAHVSNVLATPKADIRLTRNANHTSQWSSNLIETITTPTPAFGHNIGIKLFWRLLLFTSCTKNHIGIIAKDMANV